MIKGSLILLFLVGALVGGEEVDNRQCNKGPDSKNLQSVVESVVIEPCPEGANGEPCILRKGTTANLIVTFTPSVNVRRPRSAMAWISSMDMPFRALTPNACNFMECPLQAGKRTVFNATVNIDRTLPDGSFPCKVKVYERKKTVFCQLFNIKIQN